LATCQALAQAEPLISSPMPLVSACVPASRNADIGWLMPLSYIQAMPCMAFSMGIAPGLKTCLSRNLADSESFSAGPMF
jgi:hypothetical protein